MRFIAKQDFARFLARLESRNDVFVPSLRGARQFYRRSADCDESTCVDGVRTSEPLKSFFFRGREKVAEDFRASVPESSAKPFCIVGAKACDLQGFRALDTVFAEEDSEDPFYERLRAESLVLSADCSRALETCFCLAAEGKPYPEKGFDLNLSALDNGFVVEIGSEKGTHLLKEQATLFRDATPEEIAARDAGRERVVKEVEEAIRRSETPPQSRLSGKVASHYDSKIWAEEAETCVECGACQTVCPTCHCFLLYDQTKSGRLGRYRIWDSCMLRDFARVAGGANPRERLWMRLRNRFEKKFDFFPKVAGFSACTGCGRCIAACPGRIDIRKVLKRLVAHE